MKPLGLKAYGSISHIPGSKTGPRDYTCDAGQAAIACEHARPDDRVILTEKMDGSCVAAYRHGTVVHALTRSGYWAYSSKWQLHRDFAAWVRANQKTLINIPDQHWLAGEWMGTPHGTIYEHQTAAPFIPFDLLTRNKKGKAVRLPHDNARQVMADCGLHGAHILHDGPACSLERAEELLGDAGAYGATDRAEGLVWRVETKGKFNFIVKYVRHDKTPGKYLENIKDQASA